MDASHKIPVYFVPGLAASPRIFEHIRLPENYQPYYLNWLAPVHKDEPLEAYVKRMSALIEEPDPVLIGVSFGGIMVQELKKFVNPRKVIIISSVKNKEEMPALMHFSQKTNIHKIIPNITPQVIEKYEKFAFLNSLKRRVILYKKYFNINDKKYLPWAVHTVVNWDRTVTDPDIIHIHGTRDGVFPVKHLQNYIPIKRGTHVMILTRAKKISRILAEIL